MAPAPTTHTRKGCGGAPSRYGLGSSWSKRLLKVPTPSIAISMTLLASFITPAPSEVPHAMTSPGISVMSRDTMLTSL